MSINSSISSPLAEIWTEGKSDWKILKKALSVLRPDLNIAFHESDKEVGDDKLLKKLETFAEKQNPTPVIFIFDHDTPDIIAKVDDPSRGYKDWGNNIFSFSLPVPEHRSTYQNISIEFYFRDEDLLQRDENERRLFLTSEFNEKSGKYILDPTIHCAKTGYLKDHTNPEKAKIVDSEVFNAESKNIALSKSDFAENVLNSRTSFDKIDFVAFSLVFGQVEKIIADTLPKHNPYFPDLDQLFSEIKKRDRITQFQTLFKMFGDITTLALQLFIISTIRVYETEIVNEDHNYRKKVAPIRKIITEAFRQPSLSTLTELAQKCFYLVDGKSPEKLKQMKSALNATVLLGDIGQMWDDLDILFPQQYGTQRKRAGQTKDFLMDVLPDMATLLSHNDDVINDGIQNVSDMHNIDIQTWENALRQLTSILDVFFSCPLCFRSIKKLDPATKEYIFDVNIYSKGIIQNYEERFPRISDDYELKASEIQLSGDMSIHLYPLLLIKNGALFLYKRTLPTRYEYYSLVSGEIHVEYTKAKFSSSIFKTGSEQELFWTDVIPRTNPKNDIRANIPEEGPGEFIGRRKQLNRIKDEIIEIPNVNGILYGPGGIGKTALMIQLTKELYDEKLKDTVLFKNIIWVSAKRDYYDYIHDTIEVRSPQVVELRHVLYAILRFFEIENLDEYSTDDLKELVLLLLQENKVLLIVDNFETIETKDQILDFFDKRVKKELKKCPWNFKIILTSREMIPSGFSQIELTGLDLTDSKKLMVSLHKKYKSAFELSNDQKETLHQTVKGIPILLKHCFARIYEYNEPFEAVIHNLPCISSQLVQFSFKEILDRVQKEKDQIGLQILFLLEIVNRPLMIRQMADISEISEQVLQKSLPNLTNFECVRRKTIDNQEMYLLNDEISLLTQSLIRDNRNLYHDTRAKYFKNFTIDKQMAYSSDEERLIEIFDTYVKDGQLSKASEFIKEQLKKRPDSTILNYYYAKYLKESRIDIPEAIKIMEKLAETSGNHPSILRLLFSCYSITEIPNFEKADSLVSQVLSDMGETLDADIAMDIARFYVRWATHLRQKKGLDTFEDNRRISDYKERAQKVVNLLQPIEAKIGDPIWDKMTSKFSKPELYYLLSQAYFHLWEYNLAIKMIDKAIKMVGPNNPWQNTYKNMRGKIQDIQGFYSSNPWAGHTGDS